MLEITKPLYARSINEFWAGLNLANVDEYFAADYVNHNQIPGMPQGREGVKVFVSLMKSAFSDKNYVTEDLIAEGDKVVTRWSSTGKHTGDFMGVPATGKRMRVTGIAIDRIEGGKVVETWGEYDTMGMMQQLGVAPVPVG